MTETLNKDITYKEKTERVLKIRKEIKMTIAEVNGIISFCWICKRDCLKH